MIAISAMSRSRKARGRSRPARMLQQSGAPFLTAENWPEWLVSETSSSPFVVEGVGMAEDCVQCQGVRPAEAWNGMKPPPVILHRNWTNAELGLGWTGKLPMRAVVWSARMGLGNALRGLIHTFLFALLSSRQLVISPGGVYGKSVTMLFSGFQGNLDWTEKSVPRVPGYDLRNPVLPDGRPVLQGCPSGYDNGMWWPDLERRACVYGALSCSSIWCVHSRIILITIGMPRPELGEAIQDMLVTVPPAPYALPQEQAAPGLAPTPALPPAPPKLNPTAPPATAPAPASSDRGTQTPETGQAPSGALAIAGVTGGKTSRGLAEAKGAKGLRLKFDVALHVRTYHKCVEQYSFQDVPECHEHGIEHSKNVLGTFPELKQFLLVHRWACVSNLLGFLLATKIKRAREQATKYHGLFRDPRDVEDLQTYLHHTAHVKGRRPKDEGTPLYKKKKGPKDDDIWSVEDAHAVAHARAGNYSWDGSQGLSIFLATDNEALRPLFVEFLRPFGTVAFSSSRAVHLSHGDIKASHGLSSLGEFYLMSRSSALIAYNAMNSTYAEMAALYGNITLIRGHDIHRCNFAIQNIAGSPLY